MTTDMKDMRRGELMKGKGPQQPDGRSNFWGVSQATVSDASIVRSKPWRTQIRVNGYPLHLGVYESEEEAARAYDDAARALSDNPRRLNFPTEDEKQRWAEEEGKAHGNPDVG